MDILGKKNVPDVELSDDDLNALGGLSKTTASGLSYNPYQKIDPKFLELNKFDEEDDDDWLYTTVSNRNACPSRLVPTACSPFLQNLN